MSDCFKIFLFFLPIPEADGFCGFDFVFFDEAFDHIKDNFEFAVVFAFHCLDFFAQRLVAHDHFANFCECAHNLNVDPDSLFAFENRRKHSNALFGKNIGLILNILPSLQGHKL